MMCLCCCKLVNNCIIVNLLQLLLVEAISDVQLVDIDGNKQA